MNVIKNQKTSLCCINDKVSNPENYEEIKEQLQISFDTILPEKSGFEV